MPKTNKDKWINLQAMWIEHESIEGWLLQAQCPVCLKWAHKLNPYTHEFEYDFCPSCGRKMRGELNDT